MNQDIKKIICLKKNDHSPIPFSLIINIVQSLIFTEDPKLLRSAANVTMEVLNLGQESKIKTLKKENIFVDSRILFFHSKYQSFYDNQRFKKSTYSLASILFAVLRACMDLTIWVNALL